MPDLIFTIKTLADTHGAEAVADALRKVTGASKDSLDSMEHVPAAWDKVGDSEKNSGEKAEHTGMQHRALHMALDRLNEISPGLGTSMALLAHGYMEAGEAADGAAAATDGFVASMGPIAVVILAIEAATTWYKFLTESSKEAGEAQAEAWKAADEGARKAREQMEKYMEALQKARDGDSSYRDGLNQDIAVLDAQVEAQKKVLKALEQVELASAKSEDQKKSVREKYADLEQNLDKSKAEAKIKVEQQAIDRINADEEEALKKKEGFEDQRDVAAREYGAADQRARQFDKQIADLETSITAMEAEKTKLNREIGNQGQVNTVTNAGNLNESIAKGDIAQSAKSIADEVKGGQAVDPQQKAFMVEFADEIAHRMGQLKGNQNFTNAQAAATYIEKFFETQTDPYNQLFAQIFAASTAAKAEQDRLAADWLRKFADLERKVSQVGANADLH